MATRLTTLVGLVLGCVLVALWPPALADSQIQDGATMTVLRGQVAVLHPDGTAVQPAPSGTLVFAGDEIRTVANAGALVTFFSGAEIELGAETAIVVERVSRQGERIDIALRQAFGVSLNRVQTFTDPTSSYRIEAGGAVALVRGTELLVLGPVPSSRGDIVIFVCFDDCTPATTFAGCPAAPFLGYWVLVEHGRVLSGCEPFRPNVQGGIWNAAFEALEDIQRELEDRDGQTATRSNQAADNEDDGPTQPAAPGAGGTPTGTPTATLFAPTPTGTATLTPTGTPTPTLASTATPTSTETSTATPTRTLVGVAVATSTSTPTPTASATETPSATPTSTPSATSTSTPTATPTPSADLAVEKTGPAVVFQGEQIEYTVTVTNHGPEPSTGATVVDVLSDPDGRDSVAYVDADSSPECSPGGTDATAICTIGPLAAGASTTLTIVFQTSALTASFVVDDVSIDGIEADPNPSNDTDRIETPVSPPL